MTQYLVAHKLKNLVGVSIEPEGKTYEHSTKCWAIRSGAQVKFARKQMAALLANYHVAGTYEGRALYALPYDELVELLRGGMGPDDEQRFYEVKVRPRISKQHWEVFGAVGLGLTRVLAHAILRTVRLAAVLILVPILFGILKGKR